LKRQRRKTSFHFDKRWLHKDGYSEVVARAWQIPVEGTPFFQIKEKIKNTRIALLIWSSTFQTQHQQQMEELTKKLETLNEIKTGDKWEEWINTKRELNKAHFQEELYWQQKAKHKWLREGDANTRFFHAYTLQRRKLNAITRLVSSQGTVFSSQKEIESHISDFYKSLFSTEGSWGGDTLLPLISPCQAVNLQKSAIFFSRNTPQNLQSAICRTLNGITAHKSTRYLGLPLGIGKSKRE
ncbi:DNAse I-like superfamily protein, partial [Striga hermonthica]